MLEAMAGAEVGDDVLGDDPTVNALQERIAALFGKEAACFVPSGTMANQTAIRAQTEPGDEIIAHDGSHILHHETGAAAALSGVTIRALRGERGRFQVGDVHGAIQPDDPHCGNSRLLWIENTHNEGGGTVWPLVQLAEVAQAGHELGLRVHLDGARIWNACAASGHAPHEFAEHVDTVSCCFSKGLGAPAGSAVVGDRTTIARVVRFRKMFGGAMRQSGLLAAAAGYAVEHNRERLVEDHAHARMFAEALEGMPGISVEPYETNIVYFRIGEEFGTEEELCSRLDAMGVRMLGVGPQRVRAVMHLDVSRADVERAIDSIAGCCQRV